jgi:hypothetical protein
MKRHSSHTKNIFHSRKRLYRFKICHFGGMKRHNFLTRNKLQSMQRLYRFKVRQRWSVFVASKFVKKMSANTIRRRWDSLNFAYHCCLIWQLTCFIPCDLHLYFSLTGFTVNTSSRGNYYFQIRTTSRLPKNLYSIFEIYMWEFELISG